MALPPLNQLRYAQCQIPLNVEAALDAFLDEFNLDMSAIDKELDVFNLTIAPAIVEGERQLAIQIQELLAGSPIKELSSLQALQDNLYLASPLKDETDPEVVSIDERKLGALGMVLLNGKMYALAAGNALETFRQMWFSVGGNYTSFLSLGDGIADTASGDFTLIQYVPDSKTFPEINRPWEILDGLRSKVKLSKYVQPLIWTSQIGSSTSTYNKLKAIGYSDINISRILGRGQPRDSDAVLTGYLQNSTAQIKYLSALFALPFTDEKRKPRWLNEVSYMTKALQAYLQYRTQINLSSLVFSPDYWEKVKASLSPADMKEVFERRPEVLNMVVPTSPNAIGDLLNAASSLQLGSTAINSYMIKLPKDSEIYRKPYERRLLSLGVNLLQTLVLEKHSAADSLRLLLEELKGGAVSAADIIPVELTVNNVQTLQQPGFTVGSTTASVNRVIDNSPDKDKTKEAIATAVAGDTLLAPASNPTQGLASQENYMTILFRRIKWDQNFATCSKQIKKASNAPSDNIGNKFTQFGPGFKQNITPVNSTSLKGSDREAVKLNQGKQTTDVSAKYSYSCSPVFHNGFAQEIAKLQANASKELIIVCEALQRALLVVQDQIDHIIAKAQVVLDQVLGILERLLTLNLNIGGNLGFDTSLIKCSWSLDFGAKIDLFGLLLTYLNKFFKEFGGPIRAGLRLIQDLINKAICVPVRLLESFLGGVNSLLNIIGCSLKDILLPQAFLDLLKALLFTFDLRSLVLRQGYEGFNGLTANFSKNKDSFNGLTQFASLCQKTTMADATNTIGEGLLKTGVGSPALLASIITKQADVLAQKSLAASVGATI